jgi:hypothetical protein
MEAVNAKDAPLLRLKYVPSISHDFSRTLCQVLKEADCRLDEVPQIGDTR